MISREGCCETWPKPCTYHEGVQDGLDAANAVIEAAQHRIRGSHAMGCTAYGFDRGKICDCGRDALQLALADIGVGPRLLPQD